MSRLRHLCAICLLIVALPAFANGGMDESIHRGGADVWTSGKRLTLDEEYLTFDLDPDRYRVTVDYRLHDADPTRPARMYFPVLCQQESKLQACLPRLLASLNGKQAAVRPAKATPALQKAMKQLDERLAKQMQEREQEFLEYSDGELRSSAYHFYEIDLPAGQSLRQLTIQYEAPYLQWVFGTSKSPYESYSPAYANYDFSLAAAWAGNRTKALHITVNQPTRVGLVNYNTQQWPFQLTDGPLQMTVNRPDFARLPPLTLAVNNGNYLTFEHNMALLKGQLIDPPPTPRPVQYTVKALSVIPAAQHNDLAALTDGNPSTYWCWKGPHASLEMTVPTGIPFAEGFHAPLFDIALLNGAAGETRARYGSVRTLSIKTEGYPYPNGQQTRFELPHIVVQDTRNRYADSQHTDGLNLWWENNRPQTVRLRIDIERTWPGGSNDESCISELYPTYNPG